MDTFFEQLIPIKKSLLSLFTVMMIWVISILLIAFLFLYNLLGALTLFAVFGIIYGAVKLTSKFNIEYEYIITNGILDIDKITNKSSRKRYLSVDLGRTSRIEKYNPALLNKVDKKSITIACNTEDPNAYLVVVDKENSGAYYIVISPDDKMKNAITKCVPKFISNSAFK